jgi:hypothetical protein
MDDLPTERTLDLTVNCQSDAFELQVKVPTIGTTTRDLLRSAASVFDPLGFLAPVMFISKQLLRDAWETSTTWDEILDRSIIVRWEEWNLSLESLSQIDLQRCYKSTNENRLQSNFMHFPTPRKWVTELWSVLGLNFKAESR